MFYKPGHPPKAQAKGDATPQASPLSRRRINLLQPRRQDAGEIIGQIGRGPAVCGTASDEAGDSAGPSPYIVDGSIAC